MTCGLNPGLFLLLISLFQDSEETCPSICLCISDTICCSSSGLTRIPSSIPKFFTTLDLSHNHVTWLGPGHFNRMPRLENALLSHNQISTIRHGVFRNASGIRHIDLSSNKLRVVEQHYFEGLWRLEELLLYNNRITQVEANTMIGLSSLKKAYFSLNQITHFPFFSIQDHSHPFLSMLDLSSNRMSRLPWEDVKALPGLVQRGLYLHNNSLICDCTMYNVFWHWDLRGYNSLRDFADEHTCSISGDPKASIQFLKQNRFFYNCTVEKVISQTVTAFLSSVLVSEGEGVHIDCQTSLNSTNLSFTWLSPSRGFITKSSVDDTVITLFPNGTLEIQAVKVNDSGLYTCTAVDFKQALNATREVNVTVRLPQTDSFNTGYTTLLGCVITTMLILMYLYLTPCQCNCYKQPNRAGNPIVAYDPSSLSSIFFCSRKSPKPFIKHVAFMEPIGGEGTERTLES